MAKWVYQGQLCHGQDILWKTQVFLEYQDSAEIKNKAWNWLEIRVQSLSEPIVSTYNLLRSSQKSPSEKNALIPSGAKGILENIQDYIKPFS